MTTAEFTCDFTLADTDRHAAFGLFLLRCSPSCLGHSKRCLTAKVCHLLKRGKHFAHHLTAMRISSQTGLLTVGRNIPNGTVRWLLGYIIDS